MSLDRRKHKVVKCLLFYLHLHDAECISPPYYSILLDQIGRSTRTVAKGRIGKKLATIWTVCLLLIHNVTVPIVYSSQLFKHTCFSDHCLIRLSYREAK